MLQRGLVGADLSVHRREVVLALLVALALALVDVVLRHQLLDGLEVDGEVLRFLLQLRGHLRDGVLDADLPVVAGRGVRVEERLRFGGLRGELLAELGVGGGRARGRDLADVGLLWSGGVEIRASAARRSECWWASGSECIKEMVSWSWGRACWWLDHEERKDKTRWMRFWVS